MKKLRGIVPGAALLALTLAAGSANANLLVNGGFEQDLNIGNNGWNHFSSAVVDGWDGNRIEIWNNKSPFAYEGNQFAELNAHTNVGGFYTLFQSFDTVVGQSYQYSFAYRARVNSAESFNFYAGALSSTPSFTLIDDHTTSNWSLYSGSFIADSLKSVLRFTSTNTGTYGNFIDDVVVKAVAEPGVFALFGMGLLGLFAARRRQKAA